jgi:hypothetical protein
MIIGIGKLSNRRIQLRDLNKENNKIKEREHLVNKGKAKMGRIPKDSSTCISMMEKS